MNIKVKESCLIKAEDFSKNTLPDFSHLYWDKFSIKDFNKKAFEVWCRDQLPFWRDKVGSIYSKYFLECYDSFVLRAA